LYLIVASSLETALGNKRIYYF